MACPRAFVAQPEGTSKTVGNRKRMKIQPGVVRAQAGIRHVLEAIVGDAIPREAKIEAAVSGELERDVQIHEAKLPSAQNGGRNATIQFNRELFFAESKHRTNAADKAYVTFTPKGARGKIQGGSHAVLLGRLGTPRRVNAAERVQLHEVFIEPRRRKPGTDSDRFKSPRRRSMAIGNQDSPCPGGPPQCSWINPHPFSVP